MSRIIMPRNQQSLARFLSGLTHHGNPDTVSEMLPIVNQYLPSGSGFDHGTSFDVEKSNPNKLIFQTSFHHMSEHGYYTRWTDHKVTVTPSFCGFDVKVSGVNHNQIKDYIAECFDYTLSEVTGDNLIEQYVKISHANCA